MTSENCAPIELTGLSAFMADCITTERPRQRSVLSALSDIATMFWPENSTLPPLTSAGGVSRRAMAKSNVDLPHPDSPTTARNSRSASSKLTSFTALAVPAELA
jgi:hypothetical protein